MPIVHAMIGLTTWAVTLLGLERWQRHSRRESQAESGVPGVGDQAEAWLRTQERPGGRVE
jgi:hypothetical protein